MEQQNQQPIQEQKELSSTKKFFTNPKLPLIIAVAVIILAAGGVVLLKTMKYKLASTPGNNIETLEGIVRFEPLEGGCWYLQVPSTPGPLEDIAKYELSGVSESALEQYQDQQVQVKGQIREDMASICQIGTIFEVQEISFPGIANQPFDTSTWQTYRNEEYGFELKYPAPWQFEEFSNLNLSYGIILDSAGPQRDRLYIAAGGLNNCTGVPNPKFVCKQGMLAGKTATTQSVYQDNRIVQKNIGIPLTTGEQISINTTPDSTGSFSAIDQILSTFRFVE